MLLLKGSLRGAPALEAAANACMCVSNSNLCTCHIKQANSLPGMLCGVSLISRSDQQLQKTKSMLPFSAVHLRDSLHAMSTHMSGLRMEAVMLMDVTCDSLS